MRSAMIVIVCVVLFLCLTACEANDPRNLFEISTTEKPCTPNTEAEDNILMPSEDKSSFFSFEYNVCEDFQHENLLQSGGFVKYGDDILFLHLKSGRQYLYALDVNTGEVSMFCKDATCSHVACVSGSVFTKLEQHQGTLYALGNGITSWPVIALKNGKFEPIVDGGGRDFWHANGKLYVVSTDNSLLLFEHGDGEPRILIEEYTCDWNRMVGQYLFGLGAQGILRYDLDRETVTGELIVAGPCLPMPDGEHVYYLDVITNYLYRCDLDGSNAELLLKKPILSGSLNYDEDYIYFRLYTGFDPDGQDPYLKGPDSQDIYRMSKEDPTQVEKIAELPEPAREIYIVPGYDQLIVSNVAEQDEENVYYLVAKDGSSVEKLELPDF